MVNVILGTKMNQLQTFTSKGERIPVTTIQAGPCFITQIHDMPTYKSIQIGFGTKKHSTKSEEGLMKKTGLTGKLRFLRSFKVDDLSDSMKPGAQITIADVFKEGDIIRVVGTSKGKGFAGVVKRHGFKGGPRTHGQSDRERAPGSIGQTTTPGRVYVGKRMAGRMGSDRVTVKGLSVIAIDQEKNILTVKGLVPGPKGGLLIVQKEK
jgi:large subunit ribosomal protein L3